MSAKQPGARRPTHLGAWRTLAALPAMIASLLLLAFVLGGVGRREAPVLLSWLAAGVLTLSTPGERVAVRVVCRFRRLSTVEHALAMPWRLAYRVGGRLAAPLAARHPRALLALVVLIAFIITISHAIQHGEWSSAAVLSALALCPVISPIADAAISRAIEHAADQYAAQIGYNKALTLALRTTQAAEASQPRHPLLRDHPASDRRLRRLEAASGKPAWPEEFLAV